MAFPVCILLATQRSGTNMFRNVLSSDERLHCAPEVFNNRYDGRELLPEGIPYYFEFLDSKVREDHASFHPDAAYDLVSAYFQEFEDRMKAEDRTAIVDVKYSSLHHADGAWRNPSMRPEMIGLFKKRQFPILHLRRRNLVRLAFSLARAIQTDQYLAMNKSEVGDASVKLDVRLFKRSLRELKNNDRMICRWLRNTGGKQLELVYEDLFEDVPGSALQREPFEEVARFLGLEEMRFDIVPRTQKLAPQELRNEIENFNELEAALKDTEFESFLHSS